MKKYLKAGLYGVLLIPVSLKPLSLWFKMQFFNSGGILGYSVIITVYIITAMQQSLGLKRIHHASAKKLLACCVVNCTNRLTTIFVKFA